MTEKNTKRILIALMAGGILTIVFGTPDNVKIIGFSITALAFVIYGTRYVTGPHIEAQKRERGNTSLI